MHNRVYTVFLLLCLEFLCDAHNHAPGEIYKASDADHQKYHVRSEIVFNGNVEDPALADSQVNVLPCGTPELPPEKIIQVEQEVSAFLTDQIESSTLINAASRPSKIVIKTYLNVIYKEGPNDPSNVSDSVLERVMEVLNDSFTGRNLLIKDCSENTKKPGPETPFVFIRSGRINRIQNNEWHDSIDDTTMKVALRQGTCADLNIYVKEAHDPREPHGPVAGYATFPSECKAKQSTDGVVLNWKALPGISVSQPRVGVTIPHEVGHWLGLYHTFQGGCTGMGDFVSDTPPEQTGSGGCNLTRDTCTSEGLDPVTNIMDYSDDCCRTFFTNGQITRMINHSSFYRGFKTSSPIIQATNCPAGHVELFVALNTNDFPAYTSWMLVKASGTTATVIESFQAWHWQVNTMVMKSVCVRPAEKYYLIVVDAMGEGMQTATTKGSWSLLMPDGQQVQKGGNFKYHDIYEFGMPKGCRRGYKSFSLIMKTVDTLGDTSWRLKTVDGRYFARSPANYKSSALAYFETCLPPNQTYVFEMKDLRGDGLCCVDGHGFFAIYVNGIISAFVEEEIFALKNLTYTT